MIKFYKDTYANLSSLMSGANNICFATDRQVIIMGGQEYGKDAGSLKIEAGEAGCNYTPTGTRPVADGTVFLFTNNDSIWRYDGTGGGQGSWTNLFQGTVQSGEFAVGNKAGGLMSTAISGVPVATAQDVIDVGTNLEAKISGAYKSATAITRPSITDVNNIVVTKNDDDNGGIVKTNYTLDTGNITTTILDTTTAAANKGELSAVIPNAQTLAQVYEDVKSQAVTMADSIGAGSGFITWESASGLAGTTWTPTFHVLTGIESGALVNNAGTLEVKMAIRQKATNEGYLATYALFNEAGGTGDNAVQLGTDINLVKDQFLKNASYVKAVPTDATAAGYLDLNATNFAASAQVFKDAVNAASTDSNSYEDFVANYGNKVSRFLKLEFALNKTDADPETPTDTASDTDNVVYIDVNELFDSYTAGEGVAIDPNKNYIYGVVDASTEAGQHYNGNYLTVGNGKGFAVNGIKEEITGYIQDLSSVTSDANYKFLTGFGVDGTGKLTGAFAQASAQFVSFSGITAVAGTDAAARVAVTGDNVDAALNSISNTIAKMDYSYNGTAASDAADQRTKFIYAITQVDGVITETSAKSFDGSEIQVSGHAAAPLSGTGIIYTISNNSTGTGSLQSGLETIVDSTYAVIAAMDLEQVGTSAQLSSYRTDAATQTAYTIVNAVSQADGKAYATGVVLDADHVTFNGIGTTSNDGIALTGMVEQNIGTAVTVGAALSSIAKYIADSDLATVGQVGTVNGNVNNTDGGIYKVINQVGQTDGRLTAVTMDLTDGNVAAQPVAAVLPTTSNTTVDPTAARVAVDGTNVAKQIDDISNTIADFMSFHDANGNVI